MNKHSFFLIECYSSVMNTIDARKHNQQTQYELRKQVVRLRKKGLDNKAVPEIVGLCQSRPSVPTRITPSSLRSGMRRSTQKSRPMPSRKRPKFTGLTKPAFRTMPTIRMVIMSPDFKSKLAGELANHG